MLRSLKIENFRCFRSFELNSLGRINLLVGKNSSGKTSLLEAIQLFSSRFDLEAFFKFMNYRGEYSWENINLPFEINQAKCYEITHLFSEHHWSKNNKILIF